MLELNPESVGTSYCGYCGGVVFLHEEQLQDSFCPECGSPMMARRRICSCVKGEPPGSHTSHSLLSRCKNDCGGRPFCDTCGSRKTRKTARAGCYCNCGSEILVVYHICPRSSRWRYHGRALTHYECPICGQRWALKASRIRCHGL